MKLISCPPMRPSSYYDDVVYGVVLVHTQWCPIPLLASMTLSDAQCAILVSRKGLIEGHRKVDTLGGGDPFVPASVSHLSVSDNR